MSQDVALVLTDTGVAIPSRRHLQRYLENARARNTISGYRSSFRQFKIWCDEVGLIEPPASGTTIALYISAQAENLKASTIQHHLAAVAKAHNAAGLPSPMADSLLVAETLKGIKRVHGVAREQKAPVLTEDLRIMLRLTKRNPAGARDRALLLIGFAAAFRRSELVALDVADVNFTLEGLLITLRRSKTDQEGEGRQIAIPPGSHEGTCPVMALRVWLEASGVLEGAIFRPIRKGGTVLPSRLTGHAVAILIKKYVALAGLSPGSFSGHSLRAGFVTSAARAGEPERRIMRQTGHKSIEMVLRYIRHANAFTDNAVRGLGFVISAVEASEADTHG